MVVALALAAALAYAIAMVLQQHSAIETDPSLSLRPGLVGQLVRRPIWLAGVGANIAGFGLRFVALGAGSLTVVQPILVTSLLFALPLSARWHHEPLTAKDWAGAIAIAAGLAAFLISADPSRGDTNASARGWITTGAVLGAAIVVLVVIGARHTGAARAALLAGAGGILLSLTAALTKVTASHTGSEHFQVLTRWEPYALLAITAVGVVVIQSAFGAARLAASLPVLMVVEPLASVVVGVTLFHEHTSRGAAAWVVGAVGLVAMTLGILAVARSPVVAGRDADDAHYAPTPP
jgi:drug/metabolite transporter (DMT)-like permease